MSDFSSWSTDALREYEEQLYDREVNGEDVWHERDQVLQEMNSRAQLTSFQRPEGDR